MAFLYDTRDPTTALFLSDKEANKAIGLVTKAFPKVKRGSVRVVVRRGSLMGYSAVLHLGDGREPFPLTNSDFERLQGAAR